MHWQQHFCLDSKFCSAVFCSWVNPCSLVTTTSCLYQIFLPRICVKQVQFLAVRLGRNERTLTKRPSQNLPIEHLVLCVHEVSLFYLGSYTSFGWSDDIIRIVKYLCGQHLHFRCRGLMTFLLVFVSVSLCLHSFSFCLC